jgi:carboxypeptidase Q
MIAPRYMPLIGYAEAWSTPTRGILTGTPIYMEENPAAKAIFDAWLEPLRDLGTRRNVIDGIGSTDHVPFHEVGLLSPDGNLLWLPVRVHGV